MFDIGFSELLIVFVVGLLVLGPERLPHAAKMAGLWIRKIKRSINTVQREINAQLDQEELQQKISETNQRLLKEERTIQNTILPIAEKAPEEAPIETNTRIDTPTNSTNNDQHTIDTSATTDTSATKDKANKHNADM
ncbi:twin-arginine translocase subunit TatB [Marinomonas hwangdonensis]|uniref:Sec-independent protein translocase protein TatB n=1 Tax=Marinomonas hwangdonensis TaxID=1053647 RepID=A0A3M8Q946_9GAMM|nr:Sec-independent protein translocase protein TatB [Marinomonas hwangdonensis]RNF52598.1 twin-arginine translocase subunit TatB [Marinomonas hwangdonensis]